MSAILNIYFKKEQIQSMLKTVNKLGEKGLEITASINDETNEYGQNVSCYLAQTKEERDSYVPKQYLGNGKVIWTNEIIEVAKRVERPKKGSNNQTN